MAADAAELALNRRDLEVKWDLVKKLFSGVEGLASSIQQFADASREPSWRLPIAEASILDFALDVLSQTTDDSIRVQCMRLIGNCCADTNENRDRIFSQNGLQIVSSQLSLPSISTVAMAVLFNMLCDYEAGQKLAIDAHLSDAVLDAVVPLSQSESLFPAPAIRLMELLSDNPEEARVAGPSVPCRMLEIATKHTPLDLLGVLPVVLAYITTEPQQVAFVEAGGLNRLCDALELLPQNAGGNAVLGAMPRLFADMTNVPLLRLELPSEHMDHIERFILWLDPRGNAALQTAACLSLGNMIRSDDAAIFFVRERDLHLKIIGLLIQALADAQLTHACLSVLKHLAIPENTTTRSSLGSSGLLSEHILSRIWSASSSPDVQLAAVSLIRLLVTRCSPNVEAICTTTTDATDLQRLIKFHKTVEAEPIKMESARAVGFACRLMEDKALDSHTDISSTLAYLVTQNKFAVLRSEVWLVLALLAQKPLHGTAIVSNVLEIPGVLDQVKAAAAATMAIAIKEADENGTKPTNTPAEADRQNVLALLFNYLKHADLADGRRDELTQILASGIP